MVIVVTENGVRDQTAEMETKVKIMFWTSAQLEWPKSLERDCGVVQNRIKSLSLDNGACGYLAPVLRAGDPDCLCTRSCVLLPNPVLPLWKYPKIVSGLFRGTYKSETWIDRMGQGWYTGSQPAKNTGT